MADPDRYRVRVEMPGEIAQGEGYPNMDPLGEGTRVGMQTMGLPIGATRPAASTYEYLDALAHVAGGTLPGMVRVGATALNPASQNWRQFLRALAGGLGPEGGANARLSQDVLHQLEAFPRRPMTAIRNPAHMAEEGGLRFPYHNAEVRELFPGDLDRLTKRLEQTATSPRARELTGLKDAFLNAILQNFR